MLPRRQKPCPPCVVSSPRGEVALPCHRARQPHSARQSSVASSARRRAPSAVGAFFLGPPSSPFFSLGFPAGRPCAILASRKRLAVLLSFSQAQLLSAETQPISKTFSREVTSARAWTAGTAALAFRGLTSSAIKKMRGISRFSRRRKFWRCRLSYRRRHGAMAVSLRAPLFHGPVPPSSTGPTGLSGPERSPRVTAR